MFRVLALAHPLRHANAQIEIAGQECAGALRRCVVVPALAPPLRQLLRASIRAAPKIDTRSAGPQHGSSLTGSDSKMRFRLTAAIATAAILLAGRSYAEVLEFACDFGLKSDMEGRHLAEHGFSLQFRLDTVSSDAFVQGNAGLSPVLPVRGDQGTSFLEVLGSGAVQTTTIDSQGNVSHSRHTIIGGELVASQYYGQCK